MKAGSAPGRPVVAWWVCAVVVATAVAAACGPSKPTEPAARLYLDNCASCHGESGEGGIGPSLENVVAVFPNPEDQIAWVANVAHNTDGPYGAGGIGNNGQGAIAGRMPEFDRKLSPAEIRMVVDYERREFGAEILPTPPAPLSPASDVPATPMTETP